MTQPEAGRGTPAERKLSSRDFILLPLISMLTMLFVLVCSELCVRLQDETKHNVPFWSTYDQDSLFTVDDLGKRGKPNASYLKWKLNEEGYRGPALRPNTFRIVCLGSSETFGLYEREDGEWPRVLERRLNQMTNSNRFEVVNTAYPGMAMQTILLRAPRMEELLRPSLVVIYPSFTSYIPGEWQAPTPGSFHPIHPRFRSRIAPLLKDSLKTTLPESAQVWIHEASIWWTDRHLTVVHSLPQSSVDQFHVDLEELVKTLRESNSDVILVTHATRFTRPVLEKDRKYLISWHYFYPELDESGFLDMETRMNDQVRAVGKEEGIPVVDAANLIRPGERDFQEFSHFTDQGAEDLGSLVAQEVLQRIKQ